MSTNKPLLVNNGDWDFELLNLMDEEISKIAVGKYNLDCYPNQIEIISSDQMLAGYSTHALPVMYHHWKFGKTFSRERKAYQKGHMGLAYEVVTNTNPCISYLMEQNSATMQCLVIAHACYGHNSFFKNNYLFKQWTDAENIIDFLIYANKYIAECEVKYGEKAVEELLDSCHTLETFGFDRVKRVRDKSEKEKKMRLEERDDYYQSRISELWPVPENRPSLLTKTNATQRKQLMLPEPEENILLFLEKNSPTLLTWQREIVRIVRKISQYFWPQFQTKVANEGWASFWHYHLMNELYDNGMITEGSMLEFFRSHSGVVYQREMDDPHYNGINPYALGINIFQDIKRICENPTGEDKQWFPHLIGNSWQEVLDDAMKNYKDESFILQFLSPKVIRDMKLAAIEDNPLKDSHHYIVSETHDDEGYRNIRHKLAKQNDVHTTLPRILVEDIDLDGDRTLYLRHNRYNMVPLDLPMAMEAILHVRRLWGFRVVLSSYNGDKDTKAAQMIFSE